MKSIVIVLAFSLTCSMGETFAQEVPIAVDDGKAILQELSEKGIFSASELEAVQSANELNSQLIVGALAHAQFDEDPAHEISASSLAELTAIKNDLLNRASLQAIASGVVPIDQALLNRISPLLDKLEAKDLPPASLPPKVYEETLWALQKRNLILRPLCQNGLLPISAAAKKDCIPNDPWSIDLFRSVVSISVAGKPVCTGTVLDDGVVLTAAHCVIRQSGSERKLVNLSDISVFDFGKRPLALQEQPRVPTQMMPDCLPICPDFSYDFAVLRLTPAAAGLVSPIPTLNSINQGGDLPITIAGYGMSTVKTNMSNPSLQVGAQRLKIEKVDGPLEWKYSSSFNTSSSFCIGDSGGPVFNGSPRKLGDDLALVGVISRFISTDGTCFEAKATAINLTQAGPRAALCGLLNHKPQFCRQ